MTWAVFLVISFASGSIPFGLYIARARGVNIREHGSGNIGATNVLRVLGRGPGYLCFALDMLKGLLPTIAYALVSGYITGEAPSQAHAARCVAVAFAAVLGHMFTPLANFKGGKGVATAFGSLLAVVPDLTVPVIVAGLAWVVSVKATRYVGISSCIASIVLPAIIWPWTAILGRSNLALLLIGLTGALALFVIYKHRANIARTFAGTESKVGQRQPPKATPQSDSAN